MNHLFLYVQYFSNTNKPTNFMITPITLPSYNTLQNQITTNNKYKNCTNCTFHIPKNGKGNFLIFYKYIKY